MGLEGIMKQETTHLIIIAVYNLFILSLAVTMVALYNWSAWWILGAVLLFARGCKDE
jgi:hypothetical protein